VHIDYHVAIKDHYYSVPHALIKRQLDVRITANTVECFHRGQRVASHRRSYQKGRHTTVTAHMPEVGTTCSRGGPDRSVAAP
jgi:transposase